MSTKNKKIASYYAVISSSWVTESLAVTHDPFPSLIHATNTALQPPPRRHHRTAMVVVVVVAVLVLACIYLAELFI